MAVKTARKRRIAVCRRANSSGCLAIILAWPGSWHRRVPGSIAALLAGTLVVALFHLPVETIGTRFVGGIPRELPSPAIPVITWETLRHLVSPATTIALLAAIESLLCAVVADGMTDDRHDPNQELVAQGLANIVSPLFGGIAATSAIARTKSELLIIPRQVFLNVIEKEQQLALRMLEMTAQRLQMSGKRSALAFMDAQTRLARLLLELEEKEQDKGYVTISQEELAHHTGLIRQTVAKALGKSW